MNALKNNKSFIIILKVPKHESVWFILEIDDLIIFLVKSKKKILQLDFKWHISFSVVWVRERNEIFVDFL